MREGVAAALLVAACLFVAYFNVIAGDASLVYSDNKSPLDQHPAVFGPDAPGRVPLQVWARRNLTPLSNFNDPGATWWQWEPGGEFLRRAMDRSELPFWDPHAAAGTPAMANPTGTFFFPPYLAMVALGNTPLLKNAYFLSLLFGAGMFTYLFLREHDLAHVACIFGAVAFAFCGALAQNVGSFMGQTVACYPVVVYLTRRFVVTGSGRSAAVLVMGYACVALSSFPPLLLPIFGLTTAYGVVFAVRRPLPPAKRASLVCRFMAAALLSFGLVGFYYIPVLALAGDAPHVRGFYRDAGLLAVPWVSLFQVLSPVLAGTDKVLADPPLRSPFFLEVPYVGFVVAFAALLAGPRLREDRPSLFGFAGIAALGVTAKLVGLEPLQSLGRLPGLSAIHFAPYLGPLLDLLLVVLAAIGIDRLLSGRVPLAQVVCAAFATAAMLVGLWLRADAAGTLAHPAALFWIKRFGLSGAIAFGASSVAFGAARRRRETAGRFGAIALLGLLAAEGIVNTYYPRQVRWDAWKNPPRYVQVLLDKPGAGRIFSLFGLHANAGSALGLHGLDSLYAFNPPRVWRLFERYVTAQPEIFLRFGLRLPPEGVLDRANIGLFAIHQASKDFVRQATDRGYRDVFRDEAFVVFRRKTAPRYFFTSEYEVTSPDEALARIAILPPGRLILLETAGRSPSRRNADEDPPVELRHFGLNGSVLRVDAPRPGFVYASESYFTGWSATVNGVPTPILAANYAFRAVEVPAGRVEVRFRYWPPGLSAGVGLTGLSATVLVAMAWRARGRPASHSTPSP